MREGVSITVPLSLSLNVRPLYLMTIHVVPTDMAEQNPWRKRCPYGHVDLHWLRTQDRYTCGSCRSRSDIETHYYEEDEIKILG